MSRAYVVACSRHKVRGPSQLDDRGNVVHGKTKLKVRHSAKITSENILEDNDDSSELFSGYDYKVGLVLHVGLTAVLCAVMVAPTVGQGVCVRQGSGVGLDHLLRICILMMTVSCGNVPKGSRQLPRIYMATLQADSMRQDSSFRLMNSWFCAHSPTCPCPLNGM